METEDLQKTAHDHAMAGKNFFLTGSAGTGKTHTLRSIIKSLKESKKRVAVTACTGVAAQQFGSEAKTIHSFAGFLFLMTISFSQPEADWVISMFSSLMKSQCYSLSILKQSKTAPKSPVETIHPWEAFKSLAVATFSSFPREL